MTENNLYYSVDENVPFDMVACIKALVAGVVASIPLAIAYDYAIIYIPSIYINAFILGAFVFALGRIISKVLYQSKNRHIVGAFVVGCIVGVVALYVSWVVWLSIRQSHGYMFSFDDVKAIMLHPLNMRNEIIKTNTTGTRWFGRSSGPVTGVILWIVRGLEALMMMLGTALFSAQNIDKPFSEEDDDRFDEEELPTKFAVFVDKTQSITCLENGDFSHIKPHSPENPNYMTATLYSDQARKTFYLTLTEHIHDGKDTDEEDIVEYLSISPANAQKIQTII